MQFIGTIQRLQIQRSRLKIGEGSERQFDPTPILSMPAARLTPDGVIGVKNGDQFLDVHHIDHPTSVNRQFKGKFNAISFNFTAHYAKMADRFGARGEYGYAGENILIATDEPFAIEQLRLGLIIESNNRHYRLEKITVAHPCAPFSRFMLGQPSHLSAPKLKETLGFLDAGTRGFLSHWEGEPVTISIGDKAYLPA